MPAKTYRIKCFDETNTNIILELFVYDDHSIELITAPAILTPQTMHVLTQIANTMMDFMQLGGMGDMRCNKI